MNDYLIIWWDMSKNNGTIAKLEIVNEKGLFQLLNDEDYRKNGGFSVHKLGECVIDWS